MSKARYYIEKARSMAGDDPAALLYLDSLAASIEADEKDPDTALAKLAGRDDPSSIRTRLNILFNAKRIPEAVELIAHIPVHEKWCDRAILVLIENGDIERAKELRDWSHGQSNVLLRKRCDLNYAEALYRWALRGHVENEIIVPGKLAPQEREYLDEVTNALQFIKAEVAAAGVVSNELESLALQLLTRAYSLFGCFDEVRGVGTLLSTRKPIPLEVGRLVLSKKIAPPENVAGRLRSEHAGSFEADLLACMIEGEVFQHYKETFDSARRLADEAKTTRDKESVFLVLSDVAQRLGAEEREIVCQLAPELLGDNKRALGYFQIECLLREDKPSEAQIILDSVKDEKDSDWLQLYASYLIKVGNASGAVDCLLRAGETCPHPGLLQRTAQLAYDCGRLDVAAYALERVLALDPGSVPVRKNVVLVYLQQGDYVNARDHLKILHDQVPEDLECSVNYASCLSFTGYNDKALEVLQPICSRPSPPLEAILREAQILKGINQPKKAYERLHTVRKDFWDRTEFIAVFMDICHAAGEDREAQEGLMQLSELQRMGKAPHEILQEKSLDDVKEFMVGQRRNNEYLHRQMLEGKAPWLLVDRLLRQISYMGWMIRTQPMTFLWEDPLYRAQHTIYSTNLFHVQTDATGRSRLRELECPSGGNSIVADLTALMTLQRLNLLDKAREYFGTLHYPSAYMPLFVEEASRLVFHQLSQVQAVRQIKDAVDSGRIHRQEAEGSKLPCINEYTPFEKPDEHYYRLVDLADSLYQDGKISEDNLGRFRGVCCKESGVTGQHAALSMGEAIVVDLRTLQTICDIGLLGDVTRAFRVYLSKEDDKELLQDLHAVVTQENLQQWHKELREYLRDNPSRFIQTPLDVPTDERIKDVTEDIRPYLASAFLAKQLSLPLLVDDRVCQVWALNERKGEEFVAFGSDALLIAFEKRGLITADRLADCFLQLMEWRYRFLIPTLPVLRTLAGRYREHPPGSDLRKLAIYVHDCMRDPGLLGGFEATNPPVTIGNRLFQGWATLIADFLMDIWTDEGNYNDEQASILTEWAVNDCFPSPPKNMGAGGQLVTSLFDKHVLGQAMIYACRSEKYKRANKGLRLLGEKLGLGEKTYIRMVMEIIDAA